MGPKGPDLTVVADADALAVRYWPSCINLLPCRMPDRKPYMLERRSLRDSPGAYFSKKA
jgi:hypothetical protein